MHHTNNRAEIKLFTFWCLDVKVLNYINQKNKQLVHGQSFSDTPAFTHAKWNHALVFDESGLSIDFLDEPLWPEILRVFPVCLVMMNAPQIGSNGGLGRNCVASYLHL